ncbi:AMP-activated protein kinase, gamma [Nesidiocoris tenuis]|uniref:AMP-activated protein kinase, gamma n=1 Tax=Nesidiocoris tenuis TaxID=355587 RepID=A0ABN7B7T1_9HEMI|nr:AMP-activated protein kinase, gamma [Nesidiocoris tenuis]
MEILSVGFRAKANMEDEEPQPFVTPFDDAGAAAVARVPSIFEIFRPRSKSDAASKKPIVGSAKNSTKSQSSTSGDSGEHSRGPVAKVIHLFRNRSQSAASAEEKRKARAAALHQQQVAAHTAYLKGKEFSLEKSRAHSPRFLFW